MNIFTSRGDLQVYLVGALGSRIMGKPEVILRGA